jgi:phage gp16-like protein
VPAEQKQKLIQGDQKIKLAIRTSRIFQKIGRSWKQVHHHGSIEDPKLLKQYQSAVMGKK